MKTHFNPQQATAINPPIAAPAPLRGPIGIGETPTRLMDQTKDKGEEGFIQKILNFFSKLGEGIAKCWLLTIFWCMCGRKTKENEKPPLDVVEALKKRAITAITFQTVGSHLFAPMCKAAVIIKLGDETGYIQQRLDQASPTCSKDLKAFRSAALQKAEEMLKARQQKLTAQGKSISQDDVITIRSLFVQVHPNKKVSYRRYENSSSAQGAEAPGGVLASDLEAIESSPAEAFGVLQDQCGGNMEFLKFLMEEFVKKQ